MAPSTVDLAVAIPTLVGSLASFLASVTVIGLHIAFPPKRHFRHALIINLLVADLINSLNNSISGSTILASGNQAPNSSPDGKCIANAWIGQFSVQAVDFNVLIISIIVCYSVFSRRQTIAPSTRATILVCLSAWVPGLITSNIGLGLHAYGYVSGNWCWITPSRLDLRYALTHGWRIAIFLATIAIYTAIYIRLKRVFGSIRIAGPSSSTTANLSMGRDAMDNEHSDTQGILITSSFAIAHERDDQRKQGHDAAGDNTTTWSLSSMEHGRTYTPDEPTPGPPVEVSHAPVKVSLGPVEVSHGPVETGRKSVMPASPNLRRMLLMNGYPIAYIILWIPGMANRLAESIGASPRWLTILQASTQFVGVANALTYGFSEQMRRRMQKKNNSRHKFSRTQG